MPDTKAPPPLRRDLDILPIEHQGRPMFLLQDPDSLDAKHLALSPAGMAVASLLDGQRDLDQVKAALKEAAGIDADMKDLAALVEQLKESDALETPEFLAKRQKMMRDFAESPVRKAALQGLSYPEDPLVLAKTFGEYTRDAKGPGKAFPETPNGRKLTGLIAPHIDFNRGGPAYAWAYGALAETEPPDVIVALGVAHASPPSPWVMTPKAYETVWGKMEVDRGLYEDIKSKLWYDPRQDEWVHRKEHSLEFQAVWLRYLWRDRTPPWVPILCSSFERWARDKAPSSVSRVDEALDAVAEAIKARAGGGRVLILAGIDLAHVGPRFGDDIELDEALEKKIEAEDRKSMGHALALGADDFYMSVIADGHWRKVCGLSATYTALRWLKKLGAPSGKMLAYGQAPDPAGGIVSFTSAVF